MSWAEHNLNTERVLLRVISEEDLENVYRGLSDPKVIKYYGVSFLSLKETREQMKWYRSLLKNKTGIWWAIRLKSNDDFIGAIGLNDIEIEHHRGEVGFWVLPEYWGCGFTSEVLPKVLEYAFTVIKLHRVEAWVEADNTASSSVLRKVGFSHEGRLLDYEFKNGSPTSVDIFGMTKTTSHI